MPKSITTKSTDKPAKPYPDFPLYPHRSGRWAKRIRTKIHYFGKWRGMPGDGWKAALERYQQERDDLQAGRTPRVRQEGCTVKLLCNTFLTFKKARVTTGELSPRSFTDLNATTDRIMRVFDGGRLVEDLAGDDFEKLRKDIAKGRGSVAMKTEITRVRMVFGFAFKHDLIDRPVRYGAGFTPPSRTTIRKEANGVEKMFEAAELRKIIAACPTATLKAMVLVGANSGMGNHDVGLLPLSAVNLETGWVNFPRHKTGMPRRFPLWPETVTAIRESLAKRPEPRPGNEQYLFLTRKREAWSKGTTGGTLSREFAKVLAAAGVTRPGAGFYDLRRTFQTVGEEAGEIATRFIMGHCDESMSARYRQRIRDERLQAVTDHVRAWLFPPEEKTSENSENSPASA